ncbi:hypothetical protein C8N40_109146 [Pontibacter mucosus]|uniref:Uncharacterized protein n=1 Tax=Pontibacter mucosus TaxID=1649266 RepID=A0A2T5YEA0_9BACT|nr:hypothetical protein C8N40_109146 [Pontibacter mucosus]
MNIRDCFQKDSSLFEFLQTSNYTCCYSGRTSYSAPYGSFHSGVSYSKYAYSSSSFIGSTAFSHRVRNGNPGFTALNGRAVVC